MEERAEPIEYRDTVNLTYFSSIAQLERQLQAIELSYMTDKGVLEPLEAVVLTNGGASAVVVGANGDLNGGEDRKQQPNMTRLKSVTQGVYSLVKSDVGLILLLVCYAAMGAAIFSAIEEKTAKEREELDRKEFGLMLADISSRLESSHSKLPPVISLLDHEALKETTDNATWVSPVEDVTLGSPVEDVTFGSPVENVTLGNSVEEVTLRSQVGNATRSTPESSGDLDDIEKYMRDVLVKCHEYHTREESASKKQLLWTFWGAMYFCVTVFTTVGYGNIVPTTTLSRVVTMVYAALGIPLCLVVLSKVGKSLTRIIKFLWSFVRRFYYTGSCLRVRRMIPLSRFRRSLFQRVSDHVRRSTVRLTSGRQRVSEDRQRLNEIYVPYEVDDKFNLPPVVAIAIAFLYILFGAFLYTLWEEWTYVEAIYFTFISLCTIGLGDFVPDHPKFFLASSFYLLFGLALFAMVINVIMEAVTDTINKATDTVRHVRQRLIHITPSQCLTGSPPRDSIDISSRRRSV